MEMEMGVETVMEMTTLVANIENSYSIASPPNIWLNELRRMRIEMVVGWTENHPQNPNSKLHPNPVLLRLFSNKNIQPQNRAQGQNRCHRNKTMIAEKKAA